MDEPRTSQIYSDAGSLLTSRELTRLEKVDECVRFIMREKADVAMAVASCLFTGDYFEFGSVGLKTFRNMLTAADVWDLDSLGRDTHFYAFDIFGSLEPKSASAVEHSTQAASYFADFTTVGDDLARHQKILEDHGLFPDRCHLVKGLYEDTLTDPFRDEYLATGRKVGFAFLDCNITSSYEFVFEWLKDVVSDDAFIYMDEYIQNVEVPRIFDDFVEDLRIRRGLGAYYVRSAGAMGSLFRLRKI